MQTSVVSYTVHKQVLVTHRPTPPAHPSAAGVWPLKRPL